MDGWQLPHCYNPKLVMSPHRAERVSCNANSANPNCHSLHPEGGDSMVL